MTRHDRPAVAPAGTGFSLDRDNAKLGGVCAGIGNWLGIDPLPVRLAFAVTVLAGFGLPLVLYLLIWALAK